MDNILQQLYQFRKNIKEQIIAIDSEIQNTVLETEKIKLQGKLEILTKIFIGTATFLTLDSNEISYKSYCQINSYTDSPNAKQLYKKYLEICDLKKVVIRLIEDEDFLEAAKVLERYNRIKI